ncbi:MAG: glycine--tRNA ligase [Candidatus Omnitrophica bacterium]|nr:glycine--tRNA ligase [Candidatus Omnitrophota bacterium]MBU4477698.1 glycine--tRNA ligase [Candidatus Omnitrophota bacterium]MCG2703895.1 glycine--tRNA ligase [Candidatus Omnitrophota bacterium]
MSETTMEKIVSLCKRRGFIFPSSEIYGGLASTWDYGPLGAELKRNLKESWWKSVVHQREDMEGLDAAILMHPHTWKASGHLEGFTDALVDCKNCKKRFRADHLPGEGSKKKCPECKSVIDLDETPPRLFNLMLKTYLGPVEDESAVTYMRPETAQGIFVNFVNVLNSRHRKLPFGIAQIGKSFRNEITPGNFTFRTREFEQMEIEYFVKPEDAASWYERWVQERFQWYESLGINKEKLRLRPHGSDELAHYAKACTDIEYLFPFGWSELEGIANRGDFDLKQHAQVSGKDLTYFDQAQNRRYLPYVIEPSGGVDRAALAFLVDAYREEEVNEATRVVLGLNKELAPFKVAVLPLLKKKPEIVEIAKKICSGLQKKFVVKYDDTAAIGKLYRRQDEIGTLYCVTVDVQSLEDNKVTVRDRDTMQQERIEINLLEKYLTDKLV